MAEGNITVSRETLRAELAEMELRLTRWVASADSVKSLEARVSTLEASRVAREHLETDLQVMQNDIRILQDESVSRRALRRAFWGGLLIIGAVNAGAAAITLFL